MAQAALFLACNQYMYGQVSNFIYPPLERNILPRS